MIERTKKEIKISIAALARDIKEITELNKLPGLNRCDIEILTKSIMTSLEYLLKTKRK